MRISKSQNSPAMKIAEIICDESIAEWNNQFVSLVWRQIRIFTRTPRPQSILISAVMFTRAWAKRVSSCIPANLSADWVVIPFTVAAFVGQSNILFLRLFVS